MKLVLRNMFAIRRLSLLFCVQSHITYVMWRTSWSVKTRVSWWDHRMKSPILI